METDDDVSDQENHMYFTNEIYDEEENKVQITNNSYDQNYEFKRQLKVSDLIE